MAKNQTGHIRTQREQDSFNQQERMKAIRQHQAAIKDGNHAQAAVYQSRIDDLEAAISRSNRLK